jgi:hypothetical protein
MCRVRRLQTIQERYVLYLAIDGPVDRGGVYGK